MYLKRLHLKNLKGFDALDFDFSRPDGSYAGWTVLTGDNGSGKSTVLKAISIAILGQITSKALQPSFKGWIQSGKKTAEITLSILRGARDFYVKEGLTADSFDFTMQLANNSVNDDAEPVVLLENFSQQHLNSAAMPEYSIWNPATTRWFACAYGPFRRIFGSSNDAQRQMATPVINRFVTLFLEDASLNEADSWLRKKKYEELEGNYDSKEEVRMVLEMLQDELLPNGFNVEKVDSNGLWLRDTNGQLLSWTEMSDGYRSALALLIDILRHLLTAFGVKDFTRIHNNGKLFCNCDGVILIDEIDSHLHPEWQRKIGFWLKEKFPKIQFIVTSHSPLICQAADGNGIFHLPEPGSGLAPFRLSEADYTKIITSKSDSILLSPAFGLENTRSPMAVEARQKISRLHAKELGGGKLTEIEKKEEAKLEIFVTNDD